MKKILSGIILGLALGFAAAWFALHRGATGEAAKTEAAAAPAEKPKANPLQLNAAKRTAAGITLARPTDAELAPEVQAFGRALDPAPLIALLAESETARAALAASEKDAARSKKLFESGANASAQTVEAAEATATRDRVAVASVRARLIAGWGRKLADGSTLEHIVTALEKGSSLARVDLLPGDVAATDVKKVSVSVVGTTENFEADVLGAAPIADPQIPGNGLIVVLRDHALPAGATLHATLAGPGETAKVLVVPRTAVVYHQGSPWVYVLGEEDIFERKIVTLGRDVGEGVAITSGLEAADQVATMGAGQLLSAELQAGGADEEP